jgi:hypothetical protein
MKVLVACEESQAVTIELRKLGHEAFSCDIIECSGGHPEWHIKQDVLPLLNGECAFTTQNGDEWLFPCKWDMIIAHPPCTYLTITGNRWFNVERYGEKALKRIEEREKAVDFFKQIAEADCQRIAIENPVGVISSRYRKPEQIIQPWQFAICEDDLTEKTTCLWLKGLPNLEPVNKEKPEIPYHEWETPDGRKKRQTMWYYKTRCLPHAERALAASKTFPGIAKAMAEQWAGPSKED